MPATTVLLARHGETDWNRERRFQGHADPPLNPTGRAQAQRLADELAGSGIAAVYSSDLRRAHETARIVADRLGCDVAVVPALREIDVGSWSGLTRDEIAERYPAGFARWLQGGVGHDGETREALTTRVVDAVQRIAAAHPGARLLVVSHGGALRALLRHAGAELTNLRFANCSLTRLAVEDGTLRHGADC